MTHDQNYLDEVAKAAMQAIRTRDSHYPVGNLVVEAYQIAQAMLAERTRLMEEAICQRFIGETLTTDGSTEIICGRLKPCPIHDKPSMNES